MVVKHLNMHLTSMYLHSEQQVQRGVLASSTSLPPLGLVLSRRLIPPSSISADQSPSGGETLDSFFWLPPHLAISHRSNSVAVWSTQSRNVIGRDSGRKKKDSSKQPRLAVTLFIFRYSPLCCLCHNQFESCEEALRASSLGPANFLHACPSSSVDFFFFFGLVQNVVSAHLFLFRFSQNAFNNRPNQSTEGTITAIVWRKVL